MGGDGSFISKYLSRTSLLMRGESAVACVGLAVTLILIAALGASGYWLVHSQRLNQQDSRQEQVHSIGDLLAQVSEQALSAGQVSAARRLIMDAARRYELSLCRIVLPDGQVLADRDPSLITADLPQPTADSPPLSTAAPTRQVADGQIRLTYPLAIAGRIPVSLQIVASTDIADSSLWQTQAGIGVIGASALLVLLLAYRWFRSKLASMGVIREALLASSQGENDQNILSVNDDLGAEAVAWNRMLIEQQSLRKCAVVEKARDSLGCVSAGSGDLASGCDAMAQGLILLDEQAQVSYTNHAAVVFLQTNHDKLLGRPITEVITQQRLLEPLQNAVSGSTQRRTTVEIDHGDDDSGSVLRYSIHPLRHGNSQSTMLMIEDITQQRVAEDARHQFVAQATHELRTPLTNIRMYVETAIDEGENDPATRANCLNVINQETGRLERMVSDLLSVAEIEAGAIVVNRDDVRFDQMLSAIEADYGPQAQKKNITLSFNVSPKLPVLQGDREKLATALHNLVGNAIKYTPDSGRVTISAEADEKSLMIEVADTGVGIAPEDAQRIFEKFYRANDRRIKEVTGSGLGLALAREIVRLHGGDITVQSQLDQGSTFSITLPLAASNEVTAAA